MSKYNPLTDYFENLDQDEVVLSFSVIAYLIDKKLPASAFTYREWWSNEKDGSHVQAHSWMNAGWMVESVDLIRKMVRFVRI